MPAPSGQPFRRTLQPLLGFDHVAAGKARFTSAISSERHQLGRPLHGRHHRIELLFPIAMPMHEHGEVAIGERCLLMRDRVQCAPRIGEQFVASKLDALRLIQLAGNRAVLYGAFLATAIMLNGEQREEALVQWRRRGKRAFEADADVQDQN